MQTKVEDTSNFLYSQPVLHSTDKKKSILNENKDTIFFVQAKRRQAMTKQITK